MNKYPHRTIRLVFLAGIVAAGLTVLIAEHVWAGPVPPVHSERKLPERLLTKRVVIYNRPYTAAIYSVNGGTKVSHLAGGLKVYHCN